MVTHLWCEDQRLVDERAYWEVKGKVLKHADKNAAGVNSGFLRLGGPQPHMHFMLK